MLVQNSNQNDQTLVVKVFDLSTPHSHEHNISETHWGYIDWFDSNVYYDSKMNLVAKGQGHCDLTKHPFGHNSRIYFIVNIKFDTNV